MSVIHLALRSIGGRQFRSAIIATCIVVISGFLLTVTLLTVSMQHSLNVGLERMGADMIVVPEKERHKAEVAFLQGKAVSYVWMPKENLEKVAGVEGVGRVSPQFYLTSLTGAACCSTWDLFIVAIDPETDFTIKPWLVKKLDRPLGLREVVGGQFIIGEESLTLYGTELKLIGRLDATGTGLDSTIFMTFETARFMAEQSITKAMKPLEIPEGKISVIQVKVQPGYPVEDVARRITQELADVYTLTSIELTRTVQSQTSGLFRALMVAMLIIWVLASLLIALIFVMLVIERRREIGMLRAVGATRNFIFRMFLTEGFILALGGGIVGVIVATMFVYFFRGFLALTAEAPLLMPPLVSLLGYVFACLAMALTVSLPALIYPAIRASRTDPAEVMRGV